MSHALLDIGPCGAGPLKQEPLSRPGRIQWCAAALQSKTWGKARSKGNQKAIKRPRAAQNGRAIKRRRGRNWVSL